MVDSFSRKRRDTFDKVLERWPKEIQEQSHLEAIKKERTNDTENTLGLRKDKSYYGYQFREKRDTSNRLSNLRIQRSAYIEAIKEEQTYDIGKSVMAVEW